ncbi:IQ domain-containing protein M isoform X2 [Dipodomys merriami]|uniref:IQ domain-containing protein M isoform X2 n=1 Tax=Dipodomys merriami TaxID=94247 RepID=UPI003855DC7B
MAVVQAVPPKNKCHTLQIPRQNFLYEAKFLIAQHYVSLKENEVPGTSIDVFKNKYPKSHFVRYVPSKIKKTKTPDVVQEHKAVLRSICFPQILPPEGHFKKPSVFNIKERYPTVNLFTKEQVKLSKIITDIIPVSKKMEKEKQLYPGKPRALGSSHAIAAYPSVLLQRVTSTEGTQRETERVVHDWRGVMSVRSFHLHEDQKLAVSSEIFRDYCMALYHGRDLRSVMDMYRRLIYRVRHRLGLWKTRQVMNLIELEEWMDRKKFYETMFAKREDWKGLQKSELLKYFNECGHFPTQKQIDDYWEQFIKDKSRKHSEIIQKSQVIEMLFTLYPPLGAHVRQNVQLKSTWLRPIVDGEEGYKYIVSGHPILKRANIRVVGKLVAKSIRERKLKQQY